MPERGPVVPDLLAERAAAHPDGVALVLGDGPSLTFGAWHARANALAHGLRRRGVRPGDRVALLFDGADWLDYAVAYAGTLQAGAVAAPLSARLAGAEVAAAVEALGCRGLLTGGQVDPPTWSGWTDGVAAISAGRPSDPVPAGRAADDLAEILSSSGATGEPKRIGASHRNLLAGWSPGASAPHDPAQFFVHAMPVATNAGQVTLLHPLREPHTCVLLDRFDPERYCRLVAAHRATHTLLVPAMASWLLQSGAHRRHDLGSVRTVVTTAAPASPALLGRLAEVFPGATLTNSYTSTEAWPAVTAMEYDPARPGALGRPLPGHQVAVLDADGRALPAGAVGEIALRATAAPARHYVDGPAAGQTFLPGGWVRTGDLGHLDDDGYLHLVDRRADQVNTGGFNVSSVEVEAAVAEHPAVAEVAVVGVAHPTLGEVVAAAVLPRTPVTAAELRDWLRPRLADHKLPARVVLVERIPRNALGKALKAQLRDLLSGAPRPGDPARQPVAPRTGDERVLLEIWSAVLGRDDLGTDDDFLAVGGHSLAAFEIAERAAVAFGLPLSRALILTTPTVAGQARAVEAARRDGAADASPVVPIVPRARR